MKIDNLVRIVDGKLLTLPSIDSFESFIFEPSKINRGDLFIDNNSLLFEVEIAVQKGAYAILTTLDLNTLDTEIAWIKVDNLERALIKILRYIAIEKSLKIAIATTLQANFLSTIQSPKKIKILKENLVSTAKDILKAQYDERLCMLDEAQALLISPTASRIRIPLHVKQINQKGLFLSSFLHHEQYFQDVKVSSLFIKELIAVLLFLDESRMTYSLDSLMPIEHFFPLFITNNIRKKEFGMSDKVLIFEEMQELLQIEIDYLRSNVHAEDILLCLPKTMHCTLAYDSTIFYYDAYDDFEQLVNINFRYALVFGKKEEFEPFLTRELSTQPTLF